MAAACRPEARDRVMSLPQLQNLMKKDPQAYALEFDQQWSHFDSMIEIFKLKPQKPHGSFSEQAMFLAHVAPSFPAKGTALPGILIGALDEHYEVMHTDMRQVLVQALMLLRNRDQFPCIRTLPLYFKLFTLSDKQLRNTLFTHIVRDISQMNQKSRDQKTNKELRDLFFSRLQDGEAEVSRRACAVFISLYRKNVWRDASSVNLMSAGLVHPDLKIAAALAHLFLGNKTKGLEGILEGSDAEKEDDEQAQEAARGIVGARKTAGRKKRMVRAKKAVKKAVDKRKGRDERNDHVSFVAIDLLHDAQTLAERLLQRISKGGEPFLFRLLMLHLTGRLVSRHELQLPNLYPFLLKYLNPTQHEVTQILACFVEATHPQVPPEELRPIVLHVVRSFVSEAQAAEVIEVGLNAIREVCTRAVNVLTEDELADLVGFRKFKHKGVAMAARSLINAYREVDPQLLHRSLRGREAAMALSRGEVQAPQYGSQHVHDNIDGLELLVQKRRRGGGGDPQQASEEPPGAVRQLMVDHILGPEDFKQLRKLRLQRSIERQLGRKRRQEEMSSSSSGRSAEDGSEEEEAGSDGERGLLGRLPDGMSAAELRATPSRGRTKAERLARVMTGRGDFEQKMKERRKSRKGGKTNAEQRRHKPLLMALQSKRVRKKKAQNAKQKIKTMKSHIKTLKATANHRKIRRST